MLRDDSLAKKPATNSPLIERIYEGVVFAEEFLFTGFSLACINSSAVAAWTLAMLPLLACGLLIPLGLFKIIRGLINKDKNLNPAVETLSGLAFLSGLAAIPDVASFMGGWVPVSLLLPSLTLPCLGVAVSALIDLGYLLYQYSRVTDAAKERHQELVAALKMKILFTLFKVIALSALTVSAAFGAPLIAIIASAGVIAAFSLGYHCYQHYHRCRHTLFKPADEVEEKGRTKTAQQRLNYVKAKTDSAERDDSGAHGIRRASVLAQDPELTGGPRTNFSLVPEDSTDRRLRMNSTSSFDGYGPTPAARSPDSPTQQLGGQPFR